MNTEDFRTIYDYTAWANRRTLDACANLSGEQFLQNVGSSFGSVRDTLAHICGAQWIWLERWHGRVPSGLPPATDFPSMEVVRRRFEEVDRNLVDFVASLTADDLQRMVSYKSLAGAPQAQPLWQLLQHLANHSTYHRGQIATMLRQLGTKAVSTDLIAFYRELAAKPSA